MDEIKKSEEKIKNENSPEDKSQINIDKGSVSVEKEVDELLGETQRENTEREVMDMKDETNEIKEDNEIKKKEKIEEKQRKEEKLKKDEKIKKINKIIEESFEKIKDKNNILAYKEKTLSFEKLSSHCTDPELVVVDLSINKKIEEHFLKKFEVLNLPCLISYGLKIYDNENLEDNIKEKEERELNFYKKKVKRLVNQKKMFIFIKGTLEQPKCKYTKELLGLLTELGLQNALDFDYFNIFSNEILRNKLKIITEWPTYPQIFIKGKFIGGINSLNALKEQNLIKEILK